MPGRNAGTVLIVARDAGLFERAAAAIPDACSVRRADTLAAAVSALRSDGPDLMIVEEGIALGSGRPDGARPLLELLADEPLPPKVVVVSGSEDRRRAAEAIGLGAFDYYVRPIRVGEFSVLVRRALHIRELETGIPERAAPTPESRPFREMVGECDSMRAVFRSAERVAATDAGVLLVGECGTGKRVLARAIHALSSRRDGPYVVLSSHATPPELMLREIFGRPAGGGGETGAVADAERGGGCLRRADGGTLLLDGVCALPGPVQARLAAYLRDRESRPPGSGGRRVPDVRLVASTEPSHACGSDGANLQEDLRYRLGVVAIELPPLRDRGEDVAIMAREFLRRYAAEHRRRIAGFTRSAMAAVMSHSWPGNVAELEARVRRAVILSRGRMLVPADLGLDGNGSPHDRSLAEARSALERRMVTDALLQAAGNVSRAARSLGVSRPTMYDLIRKFGLELSEFKGLGGA